MIRKYLPALVISLIILSIVGLVILALRSPEEPKSSESTLSISEADKKAITTGWTKGPNEAKVVLTEFGDFQCSACKRFEPILAELDKQFAGEFKLVFKHFPLTSIHQNTELAALSAEAAGSQGKFWPMHDLLFQNQEKWAESDHPLDEFLSYARQLDIDVEKFKSDVLQKRFADKISEEQKLAERLKLTGTPSFFINGNPVDISIGVEALKKALSEAIKKSKS